MTKCTLLFLGMALFHFSCGKERERLPDVSNEKPESHPLGFWKVRIESSTKKAEFYYAVQIDSSGKLTFRGSDYCLETGLIRLEVDPEPVEVVLEAVIARGLFEVENDEYVDQALQGSVLSLSVECAFGSRSFHYQDFYGYGVGVPGIERVALTPGDCQAIACVLEVSESVIITYGIDVFSGALPVRDWLAPILLNDLRGVGAGAEAAGAYLPCITGSSGNVKDWYQWWSDRRAGYSR